MAQENELEYRFVSDMVDTLTDSDIRKIAGLIGKKIQAGEKIFNLTIGDFNPKVFPVPEEFKEEVYKAYKDNQTNYPPIVGEPILRKVLSKFIKERENLDYTPDEFLIAGGGRPLIFTYFQACVNAGETVIFPVPSWNNNYYAHIVRSNIITLETRPEVDFMPLADMLKPHIKDAAVVSMCSPLNPTGTVLQEDNLKNICNLILEENARRKKSGIKPVYLIYDQIYWLLTYGDTKHFNPVKINPEMRKYTLFVDGMSKAFAGTGIRVGWGFGDDEVITKMKSIFSHMGAFPPKPEQIAASKYLSNDGWVDAYLKNFKKEVTARLGGFYKGFMMLKNKGYRVNAIAPQAAIYLTVQIDLLGMVKPDGKKIEKTEDITGYILDDAKVGLVPFSAFGSLENPTWYRLSVGTCTMEDVDKVIENLEVSLAKLKN
ncbi:MAG: aminotransferase class I/II-fold pyridoxal phosphate-dependent enzyme [Ignavibacteria bacterium]|nr:aminotransferase class I/II-fold pyridoxal phosphate-dependent enzyme [Ignavibacteria bacterium]